MKRLTENNINSALKIRDGMISWNEIDKLLRREFIKKEENKKLHDIGYKIELVNKLYNCSLRMDKRVVAEELKNLELDSLFADKGLSPEEIVEKMGRIIPATYKRSIGPVFASKYCHFHFPEIFPIYDKFARIALSDLLDKKKGEYNGKYALFKRDLDDFMEKLNWKTSYKEIDKYLWLYGQWVEYKKYKGKPLMFEKKFSRRKRNFFQDNLDLFHNLNPN